MRIFFKVLLSLLFCCAFNTNATEDNEIVNITPSMIRWKKFPQPYVENAFLHGYDRELEILIEANEKGKIKKVKLVKSSGLAYVDIQFLLAVKKASFIPYQENGIYYPIRVLQPFKLEATREP
jgi:TonB family C-terminal domain